MGAEMTLKVWDNGEEWVIAESPSAASAIVGTRSSNWKAQPLFTEMTITYSDITDIPDEAKVNAWFWACDVFEGEYVGHKVHGHNLRGLSVTATLADWVKWKGVGYLCSVPA